MRPDMVFTQSEVEAANRSPGRPRPAPTGPDMVFTESEVAAAPRPLTLEERDRRRVPAVPAETAEALRNAGASRTSEAVGGLGAANDAAAAAGAWRGASEVYAPGYRGPFLPRSPAPAGGPDIRPPSLRPAGATPDVALGGLSTAAGLAQMYSSYSAGTREGATDRERTQAAYGVGVGGAGAAGGVLTMAGNSPAASVFGVVGGGIEVAQGVDNIRHGDVTAQGAGYQQVAHGGLAAAGGVATLAGATTMAAPLLAAGAAGVSAGTAMQQRADAVSLESGRYTEQRAGRGVGGPSTTHAITATDRAAQQGMEDGQIWRGITGSDTIGTVAGGLSTIGHSWYNTLTNLW